MIFSNKQVKGLLGLFLSAGLLISCSENNEPQVKGSNNSTFYVDALTAKFKYQTIAIQNNFGIKSFEIKEMLSAIL